MITKAKVYCSSHNRGDAAVWNEFHVSASYPTLLD